MSDNDFKYCSKERDCGLRVKITKKYETADPFCEEFGDKSASTDSKCPVLYLSNSIKSLEWFIDTKNKLLGVKTQC